MAERTIVVGDMVRRVVVFTGRISLWFGDCGFVARDDGARDVYLHRDQVVEQKGPIGTGSRVEFGVIERNCGRPEAVNARVLP